VTAAAQAATDDPKIAGARGVKDVSLRKVADCGHAGNPWVVSRARNPDHREVGRLHHLEFRTCHRPQSRNQVAKWRQASVRRRRIKEGPRLRIDDYRRIEEPSAHAAPRLRFDCVVTFHWSTIMCQRAV
jgi:hypothetical protein